MRFSRDKRGYENTFVVHGERRRGRGRSRLLYWFRTPPGVKVGRAALDEQAIRLIEELNPEIEFDWTRILKGETERPEDKRFVERRPEDRRAHRSPRQPSRNMSRPPWRGPVQERSSLPSAGEEGPPTRTASTDSPVVAEIPVAKMPSAVDEQPAALGQDEVEGPTAVEFLAPPPTAAHARLGGEGVSRLRGRYAEVMARISERVADESRREELKSEAERLNPDTWVTDDEVKAGLEEYEGVFESLRAVVGRRKRRRRRGARSGSAAGQPAAGDPGAGPGEPENEREDV